MIGCSLRVAAGVTRCLEVPAMQTRTKTWFRPLAAESWRCNPVFALPAVGEARLKSAAARTNRSLSADHGSLLTHSKG